MIKKRCEITEKKLAQQIRVENEQNRAKSTVEIQNDIEKQRAWIRTRNSKLYDNKILNLAQHTSNGSEILK